METSEKDKIQIENPAHADISKSMLLHRFVFVLYLRILPDYENEKYDNFDEADKKSINEKWYNKNTIIGKIRYCWFSPQMLKWSFWIPPKGLCKELIKSLLELIMLHNSSKIVAPWAAAGAKNW